MKPCGKYITIKVVKIKDYAVSIPDKSKTSKEKKVKTTADSVLWGFIILIPFGWIALWVSINNRRREAEHGIRDKKSAIDSINNYAVGSVISFFIWFIYLCIQSSGQNIVIVNFVALIILAVSSIHNTNRIKNIGSKSVLKDNHKSKDDDGDSEDGTMTYDDYLSKIKELKESLELIDPNDDDYEDEIFYIRNEINRFFYNCKDAEFEEGGKYKLYELKAEYFFVTGNKQQAKKFIEKAIEIREQEKRERYELLAFEDTDDEE